MTNVSSLGSRISGALLLKPGDVSSLHVKPSSTTRIAVAAGKVRWVQGDEFGIETLMMDSKAQKQLNVYIRQLVQEPI